MCLGRYDSPLKSFSLTSHELIWEKAYTQADRPNSCECLSGWWEPRAASHPVNSTLKVTSVTSIHGV